MSKLRVLVHFRDLHNYFTIHHEGDTIEVNDPDRVARLVEGGLCEEMVDASKTEKSDSSVLEEVASPVVDKPKRAYTRKKREA